MNQRPNFQTPFISGVTGGFVLVVVHAVFLQFLFMGWFHCEAALVNLKQCMMLQENVVQCLKESLEQEV